MPVSFEEIVGAARRLEGVANRTPVLTSRTFDELSGAQVFFKAENYQRVGAFKFRGAYNAFCQLSDEQKKAGVLTFSSGNHGAACALSGRLLGVPVVVVMNHDAPQIKKDAVAGYGAEVVLFDRDEQVREELGARIADERGLTIVPPYDHAHIVAGQGTAGLELFNEVPELDALVIGVGGGGLLSGCAVVAKTLCPEITVYGVEPELGDDAKRSMEAGEIVRLPKPPDTVADGARTTAIGKINFEIFQQHVERIVTVSDQQLLTTARILFDRMKTVVEPTGALGAAAVIEGKVPVKGKRVGVVISGGNADLASLAALWGLC